MKDEGRSMEVEEGASPADLRERTKKFVLRVIRLFDALPRKTGAQVPGRQLLRSATSVGANYREAQRSRYKLEFAAKVGDCLKELDETAYWLELLVDSGLMPAAKLSALCDECDQLLAIFTTIARKTKSSPAS